MRGPIDSTYYEEIVELNPEDVKRLFNNIEKERGTVMGIDILAEIHWLWLIPTAVAGWVVGNLQGAMTHIKKMDQYSEFK